MKLLSPFTLLAASATLPGVLAIPSNDNAMSRLRQMQQAQIFEQALSGNSFPIIPQEHNKNSPPQYTKEEVRTALELIDYNQFCGNTTNITMHVPQGNITFRQGYLVALPNAEPAIWTLKRDLNNNNGYNGGYSISTRTPFGKTVYWQNSYDRVDISSSEYARFNIRIVATTPDGKIAFQSASDNCIYFDDDGVARSNSNSACDFIRFRTVVSGVKAGETRWANPYPGFESCSRNVLEKYNNATGQTFNFDTLYTEDGDVEAQLGFFASIAVSVASYVITKVIDTVWP